MTRPPTVTVVVPTRDRPVQLAACLAALDEQTEPDVEVVVVDDGSLRARAVADAVAACPRARLVLGPGRGPAAARNLGAAAALAPVVCFTDDDCRPAPGWVAALVAPIRSGAAHATAGTTRNGEPGDPFAQASQTVTNHLMASSLDPASGRLGFAPTCNVASATEVVRAVPFDEAYPLAAGEDRDWCRRLVDRGWALLPVPEAVVWHHQVLGPGGFWRQQVRYGRGSYEWHRAGGGGGAGRPQPLRFYAELVRRGWSHGPVVAALVLASQLATAWGMAAQAARRRAR